ncbi:hypothetical protein [Alkalibacillus almallahensis]|uniref:hypothetical protein n=1 Tax=Alkalibacillus almallahensis TaxID=1379154 RepID=UPI0014211424|nr:hypothetical protein [Alkalibacillus almallahensis]NIK10902.1 cell shape-determining protein MreC [Alkalibacillus almallahensis]
MSEELEEVKQRLSATVLRVARSNGKTHFSNDIRWLIKQAERVEELEQENKRLREALKFYANGEHLIFAWSTGEFEGEEGETARQALEEDNNESN